MKNFKYKALSMSGTEITGVIEAMNNAEAVKRVKESGAVLLDIQEVLGKGEKKDLFSKVNYDALSLVCNQFSIVLHAGLPLMRTVELVAEQTEDKVLKKLLTYAAEDVASGRSLSSSFEERGRGKLPVTLIETIRAGEESGNLDGSFERLSQYFSKTNKTKKAVKSALTYPLFVIVVAVIVVAVIMIVAVPQFTTTFQSMGAELPLPTKLLIAMSNFFRKYTLVLVAVIAGLVIAGKVWSKTEKGKKYFAELVLRIPKIGTITRMNCASQFASTMSTMLGSGLGVMRAIGITGKAITNYVVSQDVQEAARGLESGRRLGDCIKPSKYLPELLKEMTAMGEETGSIELTLRVISEYYDNETNIATQNALKLLEPIIICFLAVFVVFVLLSVYMPMFNMYSGM